MQSDDKASKLNKSPATKTTSDPKTHTTPTTTSAAAATTTATTTTVAAADSNSKSSKQRTISALVRGLHDTGTNDLQSLHRPLLEREERLLMFAANHNSKSTPNTSPLGRRGAGAASWLHMRRCRV
ncbi:uncharacterized protein LOC133839898 [Drosophila sulfurigaster albostrigata]|uniref:uncharacterized protein LOC133839898 n=1 Tax=Drosophila sulfurigaster albostrigata TaxID=89887 RepID=UPI002D21E172|nr:uncharacterized protein LOC133839898 [Drosophila sulfurigaster albostrigata]